MRKYAFFLLFLLTTPFYLFAATAYVTNNSGNSVSAIDTDTGTVITIPMGEE